MPIILPSRLTRLGLLFLLEIMVIVALYQITASVECRMTETEALCRGLRGMVGRAISIFAVLALFFAARPDARRWFFAAAAPAGAAGWALLHLLGLALIFAPIVLFGADLGARLAQALTLMTGGALAAAVGGLLWLVPPRGWIDWLRVQRLVPLALIAVAALLPELATALEVLWQWDRLARLTFDMVAAILPLFSTGVEIDPDYYVIGAQDFFVQVAAQCSGVEGLALVTAFLGIYAVLMRDTLRQSRLWLLVWPLALLASWLLNVVRIAVLVLIGVHGAPDLAVNDFHSYAGWMFFTLLALAILALAQSLPGLHRGVAPERPPLSRDWLAARILPFIVFMIAGIVTAAFWQYPEAGYPVKALAMALALLAFRAAYARIDWRLDPLALAGGLLVGIGWIGFGSGDAAAGDLRALVGPLGAGALALWIGARLLGTVLLVPMIEELFFRGYLLARIDRGGLAARLLAITVSSAGFALLHGRWIEAGLAGVVFALLMLRRGRIADAIVAHVTANAAVAAWAVGTGDWSMI